MGLNFEELDCRRTPLGQLALRRRRLLALGGREIFEVKLDEAYLMSSLFHEGEVALTRLSLAELAGRGWEVVVGGLGLGYTAASALAYPQVTRLIVVEALAPVIDWHRQNLVPNGALLTKDARCRFHHADFFALAQSEGFAPSHPGRRFDAILLDIDHSPENVLDPAHAALYSPAGMMQLKAFLKPGGVFGMWSNDVPSKRFLEILSQVFPKVEGHVVAFENPLQGRTFENGIYTAKAE